MGMRVGVGKYRRARNANANCYDCRVRHALVTYNVVLVRARGLGARVDEDGGRLGSRTTR